jgi:ribosomal protein L22
MSRCQRECHRFKSDILLQQGDNMTDKVEPISFKEQWEAKKLLKRTKKKAKKDLLQRGHSPKEATGMIKQALKNIQSNKPIKRAAGRGG